MLRPWAANRRNFRGRWQLGQSATKRSGHLLWGAPQASRSSQAVGLAISLAPYIGPDMAQGTYTGLACLKRQRGVPYNGYCVTDISLFRYFYR